MAVILVLDIGTTTMRAALVDDRLQVVAIEARSMPPATPSPGLVEFDAAAMADAALEAATNVLASGELPVNDLVSELGLAQPQVSKHLRVLREVGAVDVRRERRQRLYSLNGRALKPIHDWVSEYERSWNARFERLDVVLDELKEKEAGDGSSD